MAYYKEEVLGVVGYGIVGEAFVEGFKQNHEIHIYDKYKEFETLDQVAQKSSIIFICLPTPFNEITKKIDLSILDENIDKLVKYTNNTEKVIVIKSTVVPGTTESYNKKYPFTNFAFNPEFLRESTYIEDFKNPDRTVIGSTSASIALRLLNIYTRAFPGKPVLRTDPTTAEMVKYMANSLLATIVLFNNIMFDICQSLGISYEEAAKMVSMDRRLVSLKNYFEVTSARGWGGKCFWKDTNALVGKAKDLKVDVSFIEKMIDENLRIRKVRDWQDIKWAVSKEDK